MKVKKAIIPAAGLGTRILPATKAIPKEMLPIVDKPAIQYIVEEAVASGIEDICIVLSRGKDVIADHFDRSPELEAKLIESGKESELSELLKISKLANITYIRQMKPKGLGHAVLMAKSFVGKEPFAVLYGDDVIMGENPACSQLIKAFNEFGVGSVGIKQVPKEDIYRYSSLKIDALRDNLFSVTDMIEKPTTPDAVLSLYSILGRCVLPYEIFDILSNIPKGSGGEYQLTDAMKVLARSNGMIGVDFIGKRYDMGSKLGILEAIVETGLTHKEVGEDFKQYLRQIAQTL